MSNESEQRYLMDSYLLDTISVVKKNVFVSGLYVRCKGNTGHGSMLIENTAAEKLVSVPTMSLLCIFFRLWSPLAQNHWKIPRIQAFSRRAVIGLLS